MDEGAAGKPGVLAFAKTYNRIKTKSTLKTKNNIFLTRSSMIFIWFSEYDHVIILTFGMLSPTAW